MAGNSFGEIFRITTFGESHGTAIGVILDGCPAGLRINTVDIQKHLDRRRPGQNDLVTPRKEKDTVQILSGTFEGITTGTPIAMILYNTDVRSADYDNLKNLFRPGHADYTYLEKYGIRDHRGSARASARETAARVAAGAVALKLLAENKISITGYIISIGPIKSKKRNLSIIENNKVRCPDASAAKEMELFLNKVKNDGDSVGAVIEVIAKGVPAGLGEPVFDKLNADIAKAVMSINAVKGIEIGDGFASTEKFGSENNDIMNKSGFESNHAGGILGGISNGNDIIVRAAVKPTSSISKRQKTIDINANTVEFEITGRHDPCVAVRAVPVVEAMMALTIADHFLRNKLSRIN